MGFARDMTAIATECARTPGRVSIWSKRLGKYVCSRDPAFQQALAEQSDNASAAHAPISASFKLVFLTAAGGTLLFVAICVTTTLLAGREPQPLLEKMITSLFDLAKIGFGAVVGLLGAQTLKR
jgi:hypothetical protein